jgi:Ca2+-binding RTX toxin-like protein
MNNRLLLSCLKSAIFVAVASASPILACGSSDSTTETPSDSGTAGQAGSGGNDGSAGSTTDSGGGGTGGSTDASTSDGDADSGVTDPFADPTFSIDTSTVPAGVAPTGCSGGLDTASGQLSIALDSQVSVLLLRVVGSEITANGVTCTAADGTKATIDNTSLIQITGSSNNENVIVDLSTGSFGSKIFSKAGGIHVDMGDGTDTVTFRGTSQKDTLRVGKDSGSIVIDATADNSADIVVTGEETLVFSLGPGADDFRAGSDSGLGTAADVPMTVYGDADDDTIEGGNANDELNGGAGEDLFDEGDSNNGSDTINGGDGKNTITYERRTVGIVATLCTSTSSVGCASAVCDCEADDGQANEKDNLVNVRHIIGGAGGDNMTGTSQDDWLEGRDGDDYLYGMAGADVLSGGAGEDTLDSGKDTDVDHLDCGAGDADVAVAGPEDVVVSCELY